jgi:hypothetical protein
MDLLGMEIGKVLNAMISVGAYQATKYLGEKSIIRITRTRYNRNGKKRPDKNRFEGTLTIGKPNFKEREFIKACKKAGEPFPVKKIQFKV